MYRVMDNPDEGTESLAEGDVYINAGTSFSFCWERMWLSLWNMKHDKHDWRSLLFNMSLIGLTQVLFSVHSWCRCGMIVHTYFPG